MTGSSQSFHFTQRFGNTPCCRTATTRFLSNGQCNTLIECSGKKSHFPGEGTTGYGQSFGIYFALFTYDFQSVNDTAHSPGPGAIGSHVRTVRIKFVDRLVAALLCVRHDLCEVECDLCYIAAREDGGRKTTRASAYSNDGWERAFTCRISNFCFQGERLSVHCYIYSKGIIHDIRGNVFFRHYGFLADFVVFYFAGYLCTPSAPVLEVG